MKTRLFASGPSLLAALLAALAAAPAAAAPAPGYIVAHVRVDHGDLDLASPAGAAEMLDRLSQAASRACGRQPSLSDPQHRAKQQAYRLCRVSALEAATLELAAPRVRSAWLATDEAIRLRPAAQRTAAERLRLAEAGAGGAVRAE